jgi:hypothetical protein
MSTELLELAGSVACAAIAAFFGSKYYTENLNRRSKFVAKAVSAAVRYVWRHYVKETKANNGKLTDEQAKMARTLARSRTRKMVADWFGKNAYKKAGFKETTNDDALDGLIQRAVVEEKAAAKGKVQ